MSDRKLIRHLNKFKSGKLPKTAAGVNKERIFFSTLPLLERERAFNELLLLQEYDTVVDLFGGWHPEAACRGAI